MKETGSITFQSTAEAFDGKTFSSSKVLPENEKEEQEKKETLNMASGDQVILPESGKVLSKVTIEKPDTMIPENIMKDIDIGGVIGTASGGASSWEDVENKPFESIGSNLLVEDGVLKVDTTDNAEEDNTRPITSAGTYTIVGNINTLLSLI